jgi:nitrite reductase/ring-hydroxylating ferredoxin subunit
VWTAVLDESDLVSGELTVGRGKWFDVLLYRADGRIHAMLDRCTHRGCALHRGTTDGQTVTCPCHGSRFRLEDGALVKGPATAPQVSFEARVRDGKVEVRPRS